jgi:hypothetical protein
MEYGIDDAAHLSDSSSAPLWSVKFRITKFDSLLKENVSLCHDRSVNEV